jgi:hypothetical protein
MNVFVSYSHKDSRWLDRLQVHMRPVERYGHIETWADTQIQPGDKWKDKIKSALEASQAAILLERVS